MDFHEAIERDRRDLLLLADRAYDAAGLVVDLGLARPSAGAAPCLASQERSLERASRELRSQWLRRAHGPGDASLKSPAAGRIATLASGEEVSFGYERDLDVSLLEGRGSAYAQQVDGWHSDLVIFSSGQAALAALLQFCIARWGKEKALRVRHLGAYFETAELLAAWPDRVVRCVESEVDMAIVEPVYCDGQFGCSEDLPAAGHALVIDTTMAGPAYDLKRHLQEGWPLVVAYSSGLKLDQAGLELANVGIVRIYSQTNPGEGSAAEVADTLRSIRGLTGAGLTLDELSALSAPWFMDRSYADPYTAAIFAHNRALAAAIGTNSATFTDRCHPSLLPASQRSEVEAPFCALQLRDPSPERYRQLLDVVRRETSRRDLVVSEGGSFGFRGHRYELITPKPEEGRPFLRVALGWREGFSRQGLCDLFHEISVNGFDVGSYERA